MGIFMRRPTLEVGLQNRSKETFAAGAQQSRRAAVAMGLLMAVGASVLSFMPGAASASDAFPSKPITLVVPNPPGGLVDTSGRIVREALSSVMNGHSIIVENKPGGSGNLGYASVARSTPDGHTILVGYSGYHVANPLLMDKLPWDLSSFSTVGMVSVATNVIAIHPSVPANNLKEFIAYLKKNPGKLNYASQGNGSVAHIGTELFKMRTGTFILHVPYRGSGAAIQDFLSGEVQLFITTPPSILGHIQKGSLKALAVTGKTRHPSLPDVPTAAEAGLKDFELDSWVALYVPSATPEAVTRRLTSDLRKALELPDAKKRAETAGIELRFMSPADVAKLTEAEIKETKVVIDQAKIKLD